ncbi:MAG: hypothetical protein K6T29_03040 [Peptococcaceae bacterium]|nr:hypothetical protein [Peptococcaceae bacterium]
MKIEILLTDISRKAEVLTRLAGDPAVKAGGSLVQVPGLELEVGENYLFFTIDRWERAEEIIPLLFSVNPAHSVHAFRPESGLKALVTCPARPVRDIIPELTAVEHLDLEAGELAGRFQVTWSSHDVAVSAQAELMVQGGLAAAKIKFVTHSRDSEYHCRACLNMISFKEILAVFCREPLGKPVEPEVGPIVIEGGPAAGAAGWAEFVNARPGVPLAYDRGAGELKMVLGPGSYISFREGGGKAAEVLVHAKDPGVFTGSLAADAAELLGLAEVKIRREIRGLILDLDRLRRELGFQLGAGPAEFIRPGEFFARYDARRQELLCEAAVPLGGPPSQERLERLHREIEEFTGRVLACAAL